MKPIGSRGLFELWEIMYRGPSLVTVTKGELHKCFLSRRQPTPQPNHSQRNIPHKMPFSRSISYKMKPTAPDKIVDPDSKAKENPLLEPSLGSWRGLCMTEKENPQHHPPCKCRNSFPWTTSEGILRVGRWSDPQGMSWLSSPGQDRARSRRLCRAHFPARYLLISKDSSHFNVMWC